MVKDDIKLDERSSDDKSRLLLLQYKRDEYFARMQTLFDLSNTVDNDEEAYQLLLDGTVNLDSFRKEYENILDSYNAQSLKVSPKATINYQCWTTFEQMYCRVKRVISRENTASSSSILSHTQQIKPQIPMSMPRLPPIELISFDGDVRNWPLFYNQFKSVIHDNPCLSDNEKIFYLVGKLTDKAKSICAGLTPTAENYSIIWSALIEKYDDTRSLACAYLNQLLEFKPLHHRSATSLDSFISTFHASVEALKQLKLSDLTDFILLHIALKKLDSDTVNSFESTHRKEKLPSYSSLVNFVKEQSKVLTRTNLKQSDIVPNKNKNFSLPKSSYTKSFINTDCGTNSKLNKNCSLCNNNSHEHLYKCQSFMKLNPFDRYSFIKNNAFCNNCLSTRHKTTNCLSKHNCSYCSARHHSLLHFNLQNRVKRDVLKSNTCAPTSDISSSSTPTTASDSPRRLTTIGPHITAPQVHDVVHNSQPNVDIVGSASVCAVSCDNLHRTRTATTTLLGTAKIKVTDNFNRTHSLRCLVDPGSQSDYVTSACCKRLSLHVSTQNCFTEVQGIGGVSQRILGVTALNFTSRFDSGKEYSIQPLVVERITSQLPDSRVDTSAIKYLKNIPLADDEFSSPGPIDILIGVKLYCEILLFNKISENNLPTALETTLGYIIMGETPIVCQPPPRASYAFCAYTSEPLDQMLEKFWVVEEVAAKRFLSPDEQNCEDIFTSTTTRNVNGSYAVDLPFKDSPKKLGNSFITAKRRYDLLERRFLKSPGLREQYNVVIREYIDRGILSHVSSEECVSHGYYLPHHPVVREDKVSTRVRIVLDGSASTDSGLSLNDILHTGCNLQADIFHILLNVRIFKIAFFADVRQMYLCIDVHPAHRKYQRILYRFSNDEPLESYEFNKVTFGLRSSPFLALRTLRKLAEDEYQNYPLAAAVLKRDIYMDDLASCAASLEVAVETAEQLIKLFKAGGFDLVKWTSNSLELLEHIPATHRQSEAISFDDGSTFKILGLHWLPATDNFVFKIEYPPSICTKRAILSATARLYDVLGLVGPVILFAKLIIKELWLLQLPWDEVPPNRIVLLWQKYLSELSLLSQLQFPRHMGIDVKSKVSLLAFADASEKAYGSVIYLHVTNGADSPVITLLCSKSRVASQKSKTTLARLELNALVLLTKLLSTVHDSLSLRQPIDNTYVFSDSTVALSWLCSSPHRFHTYVANRISQCQAVLSPDVLYHVPGSQNPADHVSRGLLPSQLLEDELWFKGPSWISLPMSEWPVQKFASDNSDLPEEKTTTLVLIEPEKNILLTLSERFSSWEKYLRATVYVLRFAGKLSRNSVITADELELAELKVIEALQNAHYSHEIKDIKRGKSCSPALRKLFPFISNNILRVGGRLEHSSLDYSQKHPILLPRKGHIVDILIDYYHRKHLHAGPQLLLSIIRQKFWILSARRIVRQRIHKCNKCFRLNPKPTFPLMADLPKCRLEQCKAFTHTGVDFAGPLYITLTRKRGVRSQKAYLCLFICLVTKAIHIELASDLSSAIFLDAFKRFLSRRGPCKFLYSDHGTNFVASKSYLNELYTFLQSDEYYKEFNQELSSHRITWRMSPPTGSHFGGLWEANIKSVKSLLFRVIGKQILTYEEMLTVLTQIEAVLNSRPLYILSSDPSEPSALTPSHFLSTAGLDFLPAFNVSGERVSLLSRFSLMNSLVQTFWKRFKTEYLHTLQTREKWNTPSNPIALGTVVLIDTQNAPPLQWPLGIITRLYPGKDGTVRIAEVKTKNGTYERPVVKLCPLPMQ